MENKLINLKTKIEDHLKKNGRQPQKKNHFMIPLEFKGKPFLGWLIFLRLYSVHLKM